MCPLIAKIVFDRFHWSLWLGGLGLAERGLERHYVLYLQPPLLLKKEAITQGDLLFQNLLGPG